MVTMEQALTCREFYSMKLTNADGTPLKVRANGKCKTWKTRPGEFQLPVKRGLREYAYISHLNASFWTVTKPV